MTVNTRFPESDWRSKYFGPENLSQTIHRVEELKSVLPESTSLPEIALRFILSHPVVSTTIVGMRNANHVRQNLALSDAGGLDAELLRKLKGHRWDRRPDVWSD
jgi:aryl-alcohol dehydrogenase-like predicted oxidoreductase